MRHLQVAEDSLLRTSTICDSNFLIGKSKIFSLYDVKMSSVYRGLNEFWAGSTKTVDFSAHKIMRPLTVFCESRLRYAFNCRKFYTIRKRKLFSTRWSRQKVKLTMA